MKDTRRRFSREFKLEAVRQLASGRRRPMWPASWASMPR